MKDLFNNPKLKNPYFILGILATIFAGAGIDIATLTSWQLFGQALLSIVQNPFVLGCVIIAVLGVWNDNSTPKLDKFKVKKEEGEE